jgi:hypothetical protein
LRVHVAALRKALGEGRARKRYIVNNPGRANTKAPGSAGRSSKPCPGAKESARTLPYQENSLRIRTGNFWAGAGNRIVRTGNFSRGSGKPDFGGDARRRLKALSRELTGLSTEGVAALVPWNWSAHRARLRQERLVRMKISHARLRPYGGPPITRGNTGSRLMENDFDRESWVKVLYSIPRCQAGLV